MAEQRTPCGAQEDDAQSHFSPSTSPHHQTLPSDAMCIIYILCLTCSELDLNVRWSRKQSLSASADEFAPNGVKFKSMSVFLSLWYEMAGNQVHARHKDTREQRKQRFTRRKARESSEEEAASSARASASPSLQLM